MSSWQEFILAALFSALLCAGAWTLGTLSSMNEVEKAARITATCQARVTQLKDKIDKVENLKELVRSIEAIQN